MDEKLHNKFIKKMPNSTHTGIYRVEAMSNLIILYEMRYRHTWKGSWGLNEVDSPSASKQVQAAAAPAA